MARAMSSHCGQVRHVLRLLGIVTVSAHGNLSLSWIAPMHHETFVIFPLPVNKLPEALSN